jgi:hypothetical protein
MFSPAVQLKERGGLPSRQHLADDRRILQAQRLGLSIRFQSLERADGRRSGDFNSLNRGEQEIYI